MSIRATVDMGRPGVMELRLLPDHETVTLSQGERTLLVAVDRVPELLRALRDLHATGVGA